MEPGVYDIALISVGGTIAGALLGTWIGYRLSLQLSIINTRKEANRRLITTFHRELSGIYPYPISWPDNIVAFLESKFITLNAAVGDFRHYLPDKEWDGFDSAWFSFYNATGREIDNKNCQCYLHYMPGISTSNVNGREVTVDTTETYKETFKHNVDRLLSYVKQK